MRINWRNLGLLFLVAAAWGATVATFESLLNVRLNDVAVLIFSMGLGSLFVERFPLAERDSL